MGLLSFKQFSSIPNLLKKIIKRTEQRENVATQIPSDFVQFLISNGKLIMEDTLLAASSINELYAVPQGKIFFLTSASMSLRNDALANGRAIMYVLTTAGIKLNFLAALGATDSRISNVANSFSIPIRVDFPNTIELQTLANNTTAAQITGYEIDFREEKQRY